MKNSFLLILLLLCGTFQLQAQKKKTKKVKKTTTQKSINISQVSPIATLSINNNYDNGTINTVCISPDGKYILSSGNDGEVRIWNIAKETQTQSFPGEKNSKGAIWPATGVAYSPDGKTFVTGQGSSSAKLWDIATGTLIKKYGQVGVAFAYDFSSDGRLIAFGHYGSVTICEVGSNKKIAIPMSKTGKVISVSFTPDNQSVISVNDTQEILLFDVNTGNKKQTFDIHNYVKDVEYAEDAAFTPDSNTLITVGLNKDPYHGIIKMWNVNDGTLLKTIIDGQSVDCIAISHDGLKFATGNFDHTVKIWDVATGNILKEFIGHKSYVRSVAFSPDDETLVSGSGRGIINIWKVN
jgi:WD40 repeat protein